MMNVVRREIRAVFAPGGSCYGCHAVLQPAEPGSLAFGIAPIHMTDRYLPNGAFDHSLPQQYLSNYATLQLVDRLSRVHPAVPPGGALLRTSVMATHDEATLDRALDAFARVKRSFESEHGPLPGAGAD